MTKYKIRYTPEAMRDMDAVWDGAYEAPKELDVADRYVNDFIDEIEKTKQFPLSGIPIVYRGFLLVFMRLGLKSIRRSIVCMTAT